MYKNAILLGLCQFLLMSSAAVGISFNGLVGERLSSSTALATLPFLTMTATTAMFTLLLPRFFAYFGYQRGFALGAAFGVIGSLIAAFAVLKQSFIVFCAAGIFIGSYQASALYYRFAAADSVPEPVHKSTAIAWVLNGGILAALLGPILASHSLHWFEQDYLGSYLVVALLVAMALPLFTFMSLPGRQLVTVNKTIPLATILRYPKAVAAMLFCAGGYAMMMLVMLASPLAMQSCGFAAQDAASVIQWHLLGMFAPSLLTGKLIARYGAMKIAFMGCAILIMGCITGLLGVELNHFHWSLMLVGAGWNFMYIGGSTLVTHIADTPLRLRLQALNEFVTFGAMTVTAGVTGWLYQNTGWQPLLWLAVIFIGVLAGVILMDLLRRRSS